VNRAAPTTSAVSIDGRATAAYGVAGTLPVGAIVVLPGGVVVRVRADGGLDEVGGVPLRKSIASDPTASPRGAR
jgi:hypothetical protein